MFWYEEEIKGLEKKRDAMPDKSGLIFYGSSSFRLWKHLEAEFSAFKGINLGFGGSTLAACTWFFERVLNGFKPTGIIIYAGDNDLGDGRHPEEVFLFYKQLLSQIRIKFGNIPVGFMSVKPSFTRWNIINSINFTNKIIEEDIKKDTNNTFFIDIHTIMTSETGFPRKDLFQLEGLHINDKGYEIWKKIIIKKLGSNGIKASK